MKILLIVLLATVSVMGITIFIAQDLKSKSDNLSPALRTEYMEGCVGDGGFQSYCACTFDWLDDNLTNEEFLDMAYQYSVTGNIPDELLLATSECT